MPAGGVPGLIWPCAALCALLNLVRNLKHSEDCLLKITALARGCVACLFHLAKCHIRLQWTYLKYDVQIPVQSSSCPGTPYLVHQGDYLCNITNHFGITSDALLTANPGVLLNNSRDNLQSGINLSLPCTQAPCCPAWTYAARAGDSYYSISKAAGVDFDKLRQANNISTTDPACCNITCGDSIVVPCSPLMASCGKWTICSDVYPAPTLCECAFVRVHD